MIRTIPLRCGKALASRLLVMVLALTGCIDDANIVPVTAENAAQVATCQTNAKEHNAFMLSAVALGAGDTSVSVVSAFAAKPGTSQVAFAITEAALAGLATIAGGGASITASAFGNGHCTSVVGALPAVRRPSP